MRALVLAAAVLVLAAEPADAHDLRPGVVALAEVAPGDYALRVVPPIDSTGEAITLTLVLPPGCASTADRVRCEAPIAGVLRVDGMRRDTTKTLVTLRRLGDDPLEWLVDRNAPAIDLGRAPPAGMVPWIRIGIEHIAGGLDHLAFVIGLLLVLELSLSRRLLVTITAFTLAHSLTLALAVLGVVTVRSAPVEACIAASVLLVAREATHRQPTAIRRWPWLAAGVFGLIHGLGFASALAELGLPRASLARSLLSFNIGVELGQLALVALVIGIVVLWRRLVGERWMIGGHVHRAASYALGALAAWWLVERVVDLACGGR